jgi:hypothetical protein
MNYDYTLSLLRDALTQRKKIEDQVRKSLEPIMPTLRFIAEMNKIYQDVYGTAETTAEEVKLPEKVAVPTKKPKNKKDVLFMEPKVKLPAGAKWSDITITFKNSQDVEVQHKDTKMGVYSHEQLGFARGNTEMNSPNKLWLLLEMLAMAEEFVSDKKVVLTKGHLKDVFQCKDENVVEKQKSSLSMSLRLALGIQEEPFEKYIPEQGYRPKFRLRPEPVLRGDGELHPSGHQHLDIYSDD